MAKQVKEKKSGDYSKKLFPMIITAIMVYTIAAFALQFFGNVEISPTLTQMYFAFWSIEIINLARIKINKVKNSENSPVKGASKIIKDVVQEVFHEDETE